MVAFPSENKKGVLFTWTVNLAMAYSLTAPHFCLFICLFGLIFVVFVQVALCVICKTPSCTLSFCFFLCLDVACVFFCK